MSNSPINPEADARAARIRELLTEFHSPPWWHPLTKWGAYLAIIIYGYGAWSQGPEVASQYLGVMAVVLLLRTAVVQREGREKELIVKIFREMEGNPTSPG